MKIFEIVTESKDSYILAVEEGEDILDECLPPLPYNLILTDCKSWYEGVITADDIERSLATLKMKPSEYYQHTRDSLFNTTNDTKYIFHVEKLDLVKKVKFVWKTQVGPGKIKYQLGNVSLRVGNAEGVLKKLLLGVTAQLDKNCVRITQLENERDRLASDRDEALSTLATCVEAKQTMEKELFGKFLCVLNEKKDFIRDLENGDDSTQTSSAALSLRAPSPIPIASTSGIKKQIVKSQGGNDKKSALFFDDFSSDEDTQPVRRNFKTTKASQKRKGESGESNKIATTTKSKTTVTTAPVLPKMTRRSTGSDSDPTKLLDIL